MQRPLVDFLVIGAMKCGTTSLHHYLSSHPSLSLPARKEVDFFFGEDPAGDGNLWRGTGWYESLFDPAAPVRGEASPGYTSPDHAEAAGWIERLAPGVRLVYLVRDPLDRAVSQHRHHVRDGTEARPLAEALTDRASHYVLRSRYAERLVPFLERFPAERIAIVDHHDLATDTAATVAGVCAFLGVDDLISRAVLERRHNAASTAPPDVPEAVAEAFHELVRDDVRRFAELRRELPNPQLALARRETA